jgi:hypothetical protein
LPAPDTASKQTVNAITNGMVKPPRLTTRLRCADREQGE